MIGELAKRCDLDLGVLTSSMAFRRLVDAVPFYSGLTLEEIGGRGVRWPAREAASALPGGGAEQPGGGGVGDFLGIAKEIAQPSTPSSDAPEAGAGSQGGGTQNGAPPPNGTLRLGLFRPIWAAPEVEIAPILKYTIARQQAELSPEDARRLGVASGDRVTVSQNGSSVTAPAVVRSGVPEGTVFLATGLAADSAAKNRHI